MGTGDLQSVTKDYQGQTGDLQSGFLISGAHIHYLFLFLIAHIISSMNISPQLPKITKGRPSTVTLQGLYEYIESLEKRREEREAKLQKELEAVLENKFASLENTIQKQIENKIELLENKMEAMETRLQVIEKQSQDTNQPSQQGDADTLESLKMKEMIKELEEKVNSCLTINSVVGKSDIKPIKDEIKKLIELDHEHKKRALNLIMFSLKEDLDEDTLAIA